MHRMHRIFSGDGWLVVLDIRIALGKAFEFENRFAEMDESSPCMPVALKSLMVWAACFGTRVLTDLSSTTTFSSTFLDIRKSARDHRRSQPLVQQPPVLIILCILCIDVQFMILLDGSARSRANGSFPMGAGRLSEKSPAGYPHLAIGRTPPGSAGVPPASSPFAWRSVSLRCDSRPPCRREPHGPSRSRAMAPLPVAPGGGDGRGCARICAGGTPALPGGLHPMTSLHQENIIAEAFGRRSSLKEVHSYWC